jgi:hypothetical protein
MKILTKKLKPAEVQCRCLVLPRDKKGFFPTPGVFFDMLEGKTPHLARLDNQFRLRAPTWFHKHRAMKAGDEITLYKEDGSILITLSRSFLKPENDTFDWAHEVLEAIRNREIHGIIRVSGTGFSVEIGEHIKNTQIFFTVKQAAELVRKGA